MTAMHADRRSAGRRRIWRASHSRRESTGEYLDRWLRGRRALRGSTFRSYETHVRRHLEPHIGEVPIAKLGVAHLDRMYDSLIGEEGPASIGIATLHRVHATLHCALNHAVRAGVIETNPASLVELPTAARFQADPWSDAELMVFLDSVVDAPLHVLFVLLGTRGLRRGEALGLRWKNVDLERRELRIVEQLSFHNGVEVFGPLKSKAGRRVVAIDETLARRLHLHGCRQRLHAKTNGWQIEDDTCVFTDERGAPLKPVSVTRHFNTLVEVHGGRRIRLHDLRHTSARIGLASGETLLEVSRRLGHSSVAITADIYSDIAPETAHASAERLSRYLRIN